MNCPECHTLITKENVRWDIDDGDDYIEVDVECENCGKVFFNRIHEADLILTIT